MTLPLWALYGLGASLCSALFPLVQEKAKTPPFAMAYLVKLVTFAFSLPWMLAVGLPTDPVFYLLIALSSVMYCVTDVVYFRVIASDGAGIVARLLPVSVIGSFFLWFAVDPKLIAVYRARPWISLGIVIVLIVAVLCAMQLRKCTVSTKAMRALWPVLAAATIGPILTKYTFAYADSTVGPPAYLCLQAGMMVLLWTGYGLVRRPVPAAIFLKRSVLGAGLVTGLLSGTVVALKNYGYATADNPAYVAVLIYLDAIWILLIYKLTGQNARGNLVAGLGIVGCAAALVVLKSLG